MTRYVTLACTLTSLILNIKSITCTPGVRSIQECYKYYNIKYSLRDLTSFKPIDKEDLKWVVEREKEEELPNWLYNQHGSLITFEESTGNPFPTLPPANGRSKRQAFELPNWWNTAVGGVNALDKEYPFMAALGYGDKKEIEYLCGGSLVSEQYVLTAAHCIFSGQREPVKYVRLGDLNITNPADDANVQEIEVATYYIHPNYSFPLRYHDIAILKLAKPVNLTDNVKPVCMEYERKFLKFKILHAAGWGLLGYGENRSDYLQKVLLRQYTLKQCRKTYPIDTRLPIGVDDDSQICAGTIRSITDTCEGDSGGPLVYEWSKTGPPIYFLTGITSFGVPCGLAPLPAIYTRLSKYIDWIEKIVWSV